MSSAYLFVHFREMSTPEGEQVRFSLSLDGFNWEAVNDGRPLMWAYYGDKGVRDFTITHSVLDGKYYILATDLSLAYNMRRYRRQFWDKVSREGSKCLAVWESDDLVHWSEQKLVKIGDEDFGCLWAPDIIFDEKEGDYIVHYSASHKSNDFGPKAIWYSRTKDFKTYSSPEILYKNPEGEIIDSAIYEEDGKYYMFVKNHCSPNRVVLMVADSVTGPYERVTAFDEAMEREGVQRGLYEAPTAVKLDDGRWCLFIDFYGASGAGQGYVPFVADSLAAGDFSRADESFRFPYGFKHGTILKITKDDYDRIKAHDWGKIRGW